jgi:hypothetical protein
MKYIKLRIFEKGDGGWQYAGLNESFSWRANYENAIPKWINCHVNPTRAMAYFIYPVE